MSKRAFILGICLIAVLIFSLYRAKYGARETVREIADVETQISAARAAQAELIAELEFRSSPDWIEAYAREELGMVPARAEQFVRPDQIESRIGPPKVRRDPSLPMDREGAP
ncbi:MAG: septum formation initiator family protein [Pseudomonadota bacterium]